MTVRLSDVAKKAGVSTATVSRVINNLSGYSEKTKVRVQKTIDDLGFKPNAIARGLVSKKTHSIGVLMPCLSSRFSFKLLNGIEKIAHKNGYSIIICNTDNNGERTLEYLRILSERRVDGIIFLSEWLKKEYGDYLMGLNIPVALVATLTHDFPFPYVKVDDKQASASAVRYLLANGHRNIGLISGSEKDQVAGQPRIEGYCQALKEAGISVCDQNIVYGDFHFESGMIGMQKLLKRNLELTAVFATSDEMALGAMTHLHSIGVELPFGMSVIGYDDTLDAEMAYPSLTTVHQPIEEMGERAMGLLLSGRKNENIILNHSISERDSVISI